MHGVNGSLVSGELHIERPLGGCELELGQGCRLDSQRLGNTAEHGVLCAIGSIARRDPGISQEPCQVWLVHGARIVHQIAHLLDHACAVPREKRGSLGRLPATLGEQPNRRREMMKRDDRLETVVTAALEHLAIVCELRFGEQAARRLDARPLDTQTIGGEAKRCDEGDILAETMVVVHCVAGRLRECRVLNILKQPRVAVHVVAFNLVRGGRDAPEKRLGKYRSQLICHTISLSCIRIRA